MTSRPRLVQKVEPHEPHLKKLYAGIRRESAKITRFKELEEVEKALATAKEELQYARDEAGATRTRATAKADELLQDVQKKVDQILSEARKEAQAIREAAWQDRSKLDEVRKEIEADQEALKLREGSLADDHEKLKEKLMLHETARQRLEEDRKALLARQKAMDEQAARIPALKGEAEKIGVEARETLRAVLKREGEIAGKEAEAEKKKQEATRLKKEAEEIRLEARRARDQAQEAHRQLLDEKSNLNLERMRVSQLADGLRKRESRVKVEEERVELKRTRLANRL